MSTEDREVYITFTTARNPSIRFIDLNDDSDKLPKRYIINKNATILFWKDDEKTIIKRSKNDNFDKRLAFLTAYFQHHCGLSKCKANKYIDDLIVESEKKEKK